MMASFWSGGRFLAVTAFIVAFPPVFSKFGKVERLKLSLSILLLYLVRGFFQLFVDAGITYGQRADSKGRTPSTMLFLNRAGTIFVFSELPLVLSAAYFGLKHMPTWCTIPYETFLNLACPIIILVEGFAAMTVILSSGQLWSEALAEQSNFVKGLVATTCLGLYCASLMVIGHLYYSGLISTVLSASLVAAVLTLFVVLTFGTVMVPHGTITDSALLLLYLTYNIWIISRQGPVISIQTKSHSLLTFISQTTWDVLPSESLSGVVTAMFKMFSMELITTILIQMAIFITAARLYRRAVGMEEDAIGRPEVAEWFVSVAWPCFGRSILVAVYTYAWLAYTRHSTLPIYLDPILWRWVNIYGCIVLYAYHLLQPTEEEFHMHSD